MGTLWATTRRRLLGLTLLAVIGGLVALSVAIYDKAFTPVVTVTLRTDHTGNQLMKGSDVKERGLIVGEVRAIHVDSGTDACQRHQVACVSVTLALEPDKVDQIPSNVSARILPKTLFGEQYVSLVPPKHASSSNAGAAPIKHGDVIDQDRSKGALAAEKVLGDLLPLLQAVRPAQLNATLTAVATALSGRGERLGDTLARLDDYLRKINPHAQRLVNDFAKLGKVADEYNDVAPDIVATLRNLQTSSRTIVDKRRQLDALLTTATDTSAILNSFLADNEQRLITLTGTTDKVYALLERYSPEFTCLLAGLNKVQQGAAATVRDDQIQLEVGLDNTSPGKYAPGQEPKLVTGYGPHCLGLPDHVTPTKSGPDGRALFQIPPAFRCFDDGAPLTDDCGGATTSGASQVAIDSPAEDALVATLISGSYGGDVHAVPPIATILTAPLLRGTVVNVR